MKIAPSCYRKQQRKCQLLPETVGLRICNEDTTRRWSWSHLPASSNFSVQLLGLDTLPFLLLPTWLLLSALSGVQQRLARLPSSISFPPQVMSLVLYLVLLPNPGTSERIFSGPALCPELQSCSPRCQLDVSTKCQVSLSHLTCPTLRS